MVSPYRALGISGIRFPGFAPGVIFGKSLWDFKPVRRPRRGISLKNGVVDLKKRCG